MKILLLVFAGLIAVGGAGFALYQCAGTELMDESIRTTPPAACPPLMGEWICSQSNLHGYTLEFYDNGAVFTTETTYTDPPRFSERLGFQGGQWRVSRTGHLILWCSMFQREGLQSFSWEIRGGNVLVLCDPTGKIYECHRRGDIKSRLRWLE